MDHSRPPTPIDGRYPSIFAVRDVASGLQLAWLPVLAETDDITAEALTGLFLEYGPPLVLKSDNGSAFKSQRLQDLLAAWRVTPLFSPPRMPRYNGACEAGNHALKDRTRQEAALRGHPDFWTSADLEVARRHSNELYLPDERTVMTAQEHWHWQAPICDNERQTFLDTVSSIQRELSTRLAANVTQPVTDHAQAALQRSVLRRALVELGLLTVTRRLITLPLNRRKMARIF
jgi:hypothetical protein